MEKFNFQIFRIFLIGSNNVILKSVSFKMRQRPMEQSSYVCDVLLMFFQRFNHDVICLDFTYSVMVDYSQN